MKKLLFLPIIILLSGCVAHLNQQQCLSTNWYNVGLSDGQSGHMPQDLSQAIQDCAKFNIAVNTTAYHNGWAMGAKTYCAPPYSIGFADGTAGKSMQTIISERNQICTYAHIPLKTASYDQGWRSGIQSYCTYNNGSLLGQQGQALPDVCPSDLQKQFAAGWNKGKDTFCNSSDNGFALGKSGQAYPDACSPALYVAFKSEYDRGSAIAQRMTDLQNQSQSLDDNINNQVSQYNLIQNNGDFYSLGSNTTPNANTALQQVNSWVHQKQKIQTQLFNLQVMK